jgi:hypothetical protein
MATDPAVRAHDEIAGPVPVPADRSVRLDEPAAVAVDRLVPADNTVCPPKLQGRRLITTTSDGTTFFSSVTRIIKPETAEIAQKFSSIITLS